MFNNKLIGLGTLKLWQLKAVNGIPNATQWLETV